MHELKQISGFQRVVAGIVLLVVGYAVFVALPVKYLPIPGFRSQGEPLNGGWSWGNLPGCFNDVPVLNFEGKDAYLVLEGNRDWHMFENITVKADADYTYLSGIMYPPNKSREIRPVNIEIKYLDLGKALRAEQITMDGQKGNSDLLSLIQCGYPSLTNYGRRLLGIRQFWAKPDS